MNKLLLLLFFPLLTYGQDSLSFEPIGNPKPVVVRQSPVFKLAPLSLLDLDPTVQAAVEIPLKPNWTLQPEVGYGWQQLGLFNYQTLSKPKSTIRARTQIRYYFSPSLTRQGTGTAKSIPSGFYGAGELLFKQMDHKTDRSVSSSTGVVTQPIVARESINIRRNVYGIHANVGYQGTISRKHPNFVVDVYMGVGFRIVSVRQTSGLPVVAANGAVGESFGFSRFVPIDSRLRKPSVTGGVKIGWMINTGKKPLKKK